MKKSGALKNAGGIFFLVKTLEAVLLNEKQKLLSIVLVVGLALLFFGCVEKPVACTAIAKVCPDGSTVGRVGPNCEFAPCPSTAPGVSASSVIQVSLHLWSSGICSDRGPNGEVRAAERDYFAYNNGTVFFKHACIAAPSTKTISRAELEGLARKVLALNTPELIAENATGSQCVGGSGTLSIAVDGKTLSFRDSCGRSSAYAEAYDAAENQLTNYFS